MHTENELKYKLQNYGAGKPMGFSFKDGDTEGQDLIRTWVNSLKDGSIQENINSMQDHASDIFLVHIAQELAKEEATLSRIPVVFSPLVPRILMMEADLQKLIFAGNIETHHNSILGTNPRKVSDSTNDKHLNKKEFGLARLIHKIHLKGIELNELNHLKDSVTALELWENLNKEYNTYLKSDKKVEDLDNFKENSKQLINGAKPALSKHRGWGNFLANLAMHIGLLLSTAGIGNAVALGISYYQGNQYLLFPILNTDSVKQLNKVEKQIDEFVPTPNSL